MDKKPLGMLWHKFQIYFALIFGAIINVLSGFNYITGSVYVSQTNGDVTAEQIYSFYGYELQIVDILYGIFLIGIGIFMIVIRQKMANFKPNALKFFYLLYPVSDGISFIYVIITATITAQSIDTSVFASIIVHLIYLLINMKYYSKRSHLFTDNTVIEQNNSQSSSIASFHGNYNVMGAEILLDTAQEAEYNGRSDDRTSVKQDVTKNNTSEKNHFVTLSKEECGYYFLADLILKSSDCSQIFEDTEIEFSPIYNFNYILYLLYLSQQILKQKYSKEYVDVIIETSIDGIAKCLSSDSDNVEKSLKDGTKELFYSLVELIDDDCSDIYKEDSLRKLAKYFLADCNIENDFFINLNVFVHFSEFIIHHTEDLLNDKIIIK